MITDTHTVTHDNTYPGKGRDWERISPMSVRKRAVKTMVATFSLLVACLALTASSALAAPSLSFGEEGSGAGQFAGGNGIAVEQSSGDVYIGDFVNNRVDKFDGEGHFLLAWGWGVADGKAELETCTTTCLVGLGGTGSGQFAADSVRGVAVDNSLGMSHGDVYVSDERNNRVEEFDSAGDFLLMLGREVNATTHGDVCDAGEDCQAGVEVPESTVAGPGEFKRLNDRSIAVDSAGHVYIGDENRIQRFSPAGVVEPGSQISLAGAGFIENIAVDSAGHIYVQARELPGVHEYESNGTEIGKPRDELGDPGTIAVGPSDELFVNDEAGEHHIFEYAAAGAQIASFDSGNEGGEGGIVYGDTQKALYLLKPRPPGTVRVVPVPPPGPLALRESVEGVGPVSATLTATVNPGGPETTSYHFEYGTSVAYGENTATTVLSGGEFEDQPAVAAITGLQPRTIYHFRVVAINKCEQEPALHPGVKVECVTDGPDQTFTTLPPVLIEGESTTQVSAETARLGAELDPLGSETEYHFEYGPTATYGTSAPTPEATAGSGSGPVSVAPLEIQGLAPNTIYHYRVVAHNAFGEVQGEDRTFTTQGEAVSSVLADGREWEMVSPVNKEGAALEAIGEIEGGVIQASEGGSAMTYVATGAIEADAPSNRSVVDTQVFSKRGVGGWQSKDIETPHEAVATLAAGERSEYRLFSGDLSRAIVVPEGETPLSAGTTERTPYLRNNFAGEGICSSPAGAPDSSSCYTPLVSSCPEAPTPCPKGVEEVANTLAGTKWGYSGLTFQGASADTSRVVLGSAQNLVAGFEGAGQQNFFEWSGGILRPVSVLPNGESTGEAGLTAGMGGDSGHNKRGAVSATGDRVVFTAGTSVDEHLYLRDMTLGKTVQLDAPQSGCSTCTSGGLPEFQVASSDAGKVFFTDEARLTSDSTAKLDEPDLYMCEVSVVAGDPTCALTDLSVDHNVSEAANVQGSFAGGGEVSAISEDGRMIYFAADGVLAPGAVPGDCAQASEAATCNLYVHDTVSGQTRLVAEVSGLDAPDWNGHAGTGGPIFLTARASPDGRYFAFMSERSLTGYDNRDANNGLRDEEAYLYHTPENLKTETGTLTCASCNSSGARPEGVFDPNHLPGMLLVDRTVTWGGRWLSGSIPAWTSYEGGGGFSLYQSRYLSNSGRMFFDSADALVPQDANAKEDVYEYEPQGVGDCTSPTGCQNLISSGTSPKESAFMDASTDGSDVFFITAAKLSEADVDSSFDIYDAHICTSSAPCPESATAVPPPCTTADSCRAAPSPQPSIFGVPPSATFNGSGNVKAQALAVKPKAKPLTRAQKLTKALKACKAKQSKRKRRTCEASARKKYGAKIKSKSKSHKGAK